MVSGPSQLLLKFDFASTQQCLMLSPKTFWKILLKKYASHHLHYKSIPLFTNVILLRSLWCCQLMFNSSLFIKPVKSFWSVLLCWGLLGVSPTLVNLVEAHGFISEEYYLHWYEAFWGSPKQSHESLCSKWTISYHYGEFFFYSQLGLWIS